MSLKSALVTGGAGFIGSHLVERLLGQGAKVRVLDDFATGHEANLASFKSNKHFELLKGSICEADDLRRALEGVDWVFHLAARPSVPRSVEDPWSSHQINLQGTLRLLEASRQARISRFINTSSSSVYGDTPQLPKSEEMAGNTLSPYALQKWAGEEYVRLYARLYNFPGLSIRPFNVFGPRQDPESLYAAVIPRFIKAARAGTDLVIFGDGQQSRDFTYVSNLIDLYMKAAESTDSRIFGQAFNGGAGGRVSVLEMAEKILRLTSSSAKVSFASPRAGDIRDSFASGAKVQKYFEHTAKISFAEGLQLLIDSTSEVKADKK